MRSGHTALGVQRGPSAEGPFNRHIERWKVGQPADFQQADSGSAGGRVGVVDGLSKLTKGG